MSDVLRFELDTAPFEEQLQEAETKLRQFREEEKGPSAVTVPATGGKRGEQSAVSLVVPGKTETSPSGSVQNDAPDQRGSQAEDQTSLLLREMLEYTIQNNQLLEQLLEQLQAIAENQEESLRRDETDDEITECVEYL